MISEASEAHSSAPAVPWGKRCSLAHDLNNHLTVILGHCEFLLDQATDDGCKADVQAILEAAHTMAREISQHECAVVRIMQGE
jgi:hypothetical protein